MADKYVRPSELSVAVLEQLHLYSARVEDELNKGARKIAHETNDIITQHSNFNILSGKYLKSFAIKQNERGYWVWYVKPPNYRLTHLLENGHNIVNGNGNVIGIDYTCQVFAKHNIRRRYQLLAFALWQHPLGYNKPYAAEHIDPFIKIILHPFNVLSSSS